MSAPPNAPARTPPTPADLRRLRDICRDADGVQRDRARTYLMISSLTTTVSAQDFVAALLDVCDVNARFAISRGHTKREQAEWRRLAEVIQRYVGG